MRRLLLLAFSLLAFSGPAHAADDSLGVQSALGINAGPAANGAAAPGDKPQSPVAVAPAEVQLESISPANRAANASSEVFGAQLFTGAFARQGPTQFNPDYLIAIGDRIQIRMWGGFNFDSVLMVDPQGNLFLPNVGPVRALGVRNEDLQRAVEAAVRRVYRANVYSYASLAAAQPVRIFVGGFVLRPGLYNGTSMDSLLHFLDQAGGIDPARGSFLDVQVKRGNQVRARINFYDFLLQGRIPLVQLADGDVIFVAPRKNTVRVQGLAENARRFEFAEPTLRVSELMRLAKPRAEVTHVRVIRNTGVIRNVDYYPLAEAANVTIANGDEVEFTADKKPGTITVRVEGEHLSAQEYVLPYGARYGDLLQHIQFSERSAKNSIQLYRKSVAERQKQLLQTSLRSLETTALTARSGTSDEARLRKEEADLILQWVERAKKVEPSGQVLIAQSPQRDQLLLENGDIIRVPTRDGLVLISGEVLFPNAVAYEKDLTLKGYVQRAGGYTQNADASRIVIAHRDGSFDEGRKAEVKSGDEILVLPKIDVKSRQIAKDITQILYQIAISARVVLGL